MMFTPRLRPLVLAVLTVTLSLQSEAALDEVQVRMLQSYSLPLRWDNVERAPQWVNGVQPAYRSEQGLHVVRFAPGDAVTLRVAGGEQVRVWRMDGTLDRADLEMDFSAGSGLYQRLPTALSADHRGMLSRIQMTSPYLARISRPRQSSLTLEVALFISRHEPPGELAPYRGVIDLPGTAVQMRREDQAAAQTYWNFTPQQPVEVRVKGPARYAFEHRYAYAAKESGLAQTYRVNAWIDGHVLANLEFETSAESAYPVYVNRHMRVMGRGEVGYLEIPPGDHLLRLDSTAPLVGRLLLQEQTDYLLPAMNEPVRTALQVREQDDPFRLTTSGQLIDAVQLHSQSIQESRPAPVPLQSRLSPWLVQPAELAKASQERTLTPTEQESAALRIARDNARQEGGLLSAMLMQESAKKNPDYPAVQTVASELLGYHSFYRDLLPRENLTAAGQYFARFIPRDLHAFGNQGRGITQGEQHLQELLNRIPGAYFTDIPVHIRSSKIDVQAEGRNLKLTLPADVLFDTDKSVLKPHFQSLLEEAAALILSRHPQQIRVIGHTDSRASGKYNQRLSERRAQAVAGFLARNGISPVILHSLGKGELQPRASNDSVSGRQSNRRVEILLEGVQKSVSPPQEKNGYHRYVLPARAEPSLLRVIVDAPESDESEFLLQFDDAEPIRMRVVAGQELPVEEYAPAQGDAALEILAHQFGRENASITDGPYSARRVPGKLVRARLVEIPLPSQVHEVRVWRSENFDHPVHVALQYRAAKPFVLSESEYLEMVARTGEAAQVLGVFARTLKSATAAESDRGAQELGNHWLPLVRALRSGYKVFSAPVVAPQIPVGTAHLSAEQQIRLRAQAQIAEREGRWSSALDVWGDLVRRAPIPLREEAMLAQTEALLHLGEDYLAEQQLRSLSLYAGEQAIRQRAGERLDAFYRSNGDTASLVLLWGSLSVQKPDVLNLRHLAEALVDNSEYQFALEVGLLLPEAEQPRDHLLRAAYQLGWWSVYQRLVASIESAEPRAVWQGLSAISQGHISQARVHFEAGGDQGKTWLTALDSGAALAQQLHQHSALDDVDVDAWQRWHSAHPGPFAWREEAQLVTDFAGSEILYSVDRDAYSRAYLATADKPVRLRLMGPLRLRIESRPVHAASATQPVDGWLRLKEANGLRVLPVSNNIPAAGLELAGRSDLKPGRKVSSEFDFGPGLHEVEVDAGSLPVLLRVLARRPEMMIPLAPALYADSLMGKNPEPVLAENENAYTCWWKDCAVLVPPGEEAAAYSRDLRLDPLHAKESQPREIPAGTLMRQEPALPPAGERMSGMAWPEGEKLAAGDVAAALAMHPGNNEIDALRRMTLLLWWSEQNPAMHQRALIEGESLGARYPANVELQSVLSRLSRDALWQPATGVQDSAGQRYLEVTGWQPESAALRARKALMRDYGATDQMVSGNGRLVFSLRNLKSGPVELHLTKEEVNALAPLPLKAFYQLDGSTPVAVPLTPAQPLRKLRLNIPAGDHLIRVWIDAPLADQFLRVNLVERGPTVPMTLVERPWHVASRREPLRVAVAGPAWLLIDELRDGKVESRYQWVSTDFEELILPPSGQRAESLYRIHQRTLVPGSTPILPRVVEVQTDPVPQAYARIETTEAARKVAFQDGFPLGGQEDGTWSFTANQVRRGSLEADAIKGQPTENYLELKGTHRYFDEDNRSYYQTELFGRVREYGNPTVGAKGLWSYDPLQVPVTFTLEGGVYVQQPGGATGMRQQPMSIDSGLAQVMCQNPGLAPTNPSDAQSIIEYRKNLLSQFPALNTEEFNQALQQLKNNLPSILVTLRNYIPFSNQMPTEVSRVTRLVFGGSLSSTINAYIINQYTEIGLDGNGLPYNKGAPVGPDLLLERWSNFVGQQDAPFKLLDDVIASNFSGFLGPENTKPEIVASYSTNLNINLEKCNKYVESRRNDNVTLAPRSHGTEWAAEIKATLSQHRDISPKAYHVPQLSVFFRESSLKENLLYSGDALNSTLNASLAALNSLVDLYNQDMPELVSRTEVDLARQDIKFIENLKRNLNKYFYLYDPRYLDQDVFTQYKADHRRGVEVGDTLYYKPWLDSQGYLGLNATSNENGDIFNPDHVTGKIGWKQLLGSFQLDQEYRSTRYFADDHRASEYGRQSYHLQVQWNKWTTGQNRMEVGFHFGRDFSVHENTGMLYFTWHDGNGRRYSDFRQGEVDFRDLRTRDIPATPNNAVKESKND